MFLFFNLVFVKIFVFAFSVSLPSHLNFFCNIIPDSLKHPLCFQSCKTKIYSSFGAPITESVNVFYPALDKVITSSGIFNFDQYLIQLPGFKPFDHAQQLLIADIHHPCNYFSFTATTCKSTCVPKYLSFVVANGLLCLVEKADYMFTGGTLNSPHVPISFINVKNKWITIYSDPPLSSFSLSGITFIKNTSDSILFRFPSTVFYHQFFDQLLLSIDATDFKVSCSNFSSLYFDINVVQSSECIFTITHSGINVCMAAYGSFCGNLIHRKLPSRFFSFNIIDDPLDLATKIESEQLKNISLNFDTFVKNFSPDAVVTIANSSLNVSLLLFDQLFKTFSNYSSVFQRFTSKDLRIFGFKALIDSVKNLNTTMKVDRTDIEFFWRYYFYFLTHNDTYLQSDINKVGSIGSWIADIFISLLKPFFQVLISFISEILMTVIEFLLDFEPYIIKLLDVLENALEKIIDLIYRLIVAILSIITRLISFIDQKFHLFEFCFLYIFIYVYISDNHFVCIFTVLSLVWLLGFNRYFPSLIPAFSFVFQHIQDYLHNKTDFQVDYIDFIAPLFNDTFVNRTHNFSYSNYSMYLYYFDNVFDSNFTFLTI